MAQNHETTFKSKVFSQAKQHHQQQITKEQGFVTLARTNNHAQLLIETVENENTLVMRMAHLQGGGSIQSCGSNNPCGLGHIPGCGCDSGYGNVQVKRWNFSYDDFSKIGETIIMPIENIQLMMETMYRYENYSVIFWKDVNNDRNRVYVKILENCIAYHVLNERNQLKTGKVKLNINVNLLVQSNTSLTEQIFEKLNIQATDTSISFWIHDMDEKNIDDKHIFVKQHSDKELTCLFKENGVQTTRTIEIGKSNVKTFFSTLLYSIQRKLIPHLDKEGNIDLSQKLGTKFNMAGKYNVVEFLKQSFGGETSHSCITWALDMLTVMGVHLPSRYKVNIITNTSYYTDYLLNCSFQVTGMDMCYFAKHGLTSVIKFHAERLKEHDKDSMKRILNTTYRKATVGPHESKLFNYTPLGLAVLYGKTETAKLLIELGAEVDCEFGNWLFGTKVFQVYNKLVGELNLSKLCQ